jgi:outer membrane protein assembly factor BamB
MKRSPADCRPAGGWRTADEVCLPRRIGRLALAALLFSAGSALLAEPALGHKDFMPSAARPVGWRGDGTGNFPGAAIVTRWHERTGENVLWKLPMPFGYGSPIVVGKLVFTQADPNVLYAVDAAGGKIAWQCDRNAIAPEEEKELRGWMSWHGRSYPTPSSDGKHVYAKFADTVECYTLDGKRVWTSPTGLPANARNYVTQSPILVAGRVIFLTCGQRRNDDVLVALAAATGKEAWRTSVLRDRGAETAGAAMPVAVRLGGADVVVTHMGDAVRATDGKLLGSALFAQPDLMPLPYNITTVVSPAGEVLLRMHRPRTQEGLMQQDLRVMALRLRLARDANERIVAEPVWGPRMVEAREGSGPAFITQIQHVLYMGGHWYLQGWPDLITLDARDGNTVTWSKAPREMRGHAVWHEFPTLHQAGKLLFVGDRNGTAAVYEAGPAWKFVAMSKVDETWHSNPFFQGDRLYIRTRNALYCIGPRSPSPSRQ